MSSSIYLGVPGAGKSFGIVRYVIVPALERGQRVITNIPLVEPALCDYLGKNLDGLIKLVNADDIRSPNFWFTAEGIGDTITQGGDCVVIDEGHEFYGPDQKIKSDHEVFRAIRLQRKYTGGSGNFSTDIVFATQDYSDVCKSLRNVCGSMYYMQKLLVVGKPTTYRVDVYADCRKTPERGRPVNSMFGDYSPEIFPLYNSYSAGVGAFSSNAPGVEVITDDRLNVWNSKISIGPFKLTVKQAKYSAIALAALSSIIFIWVFVGYLTKPVVPSAPAAAPGAAPPAAPALAPGAVPAAAPGAAPASSPTAAPGSSPVGALSKAIPNESDEFRLVGFYELGASTYAVIADAKGKYRYLQSGAFSDTDFQLVHAGPATHIKFKGHVIAPWTGPAPIQGVSNTKMEKSK